MPQQTQEGGLPRTVGEATQYTLDLWNEIGDRLDRQEEVPNELWDTWGEWETQLERMSYGSDPGREAYRSVLSDVRADAQRRNGDVGQILGEINRIETAQPGMSGLTREQEVQIEDLQQQVLPEAQGLDRKPGFFERAWKAITPGEAKPHRVRQATSNREFRGDEYYLDPALAALPFEPSPEAQRAAWLMRDPSPSEFRKVDGDTREIRRDQNGVEWDITDYRRQLDDPKVEENLIAGLNGSVSGTGLASYVAGGAPVATNAVRYLTTGETKQQYETADPELRLPWTVMQNLSEVGIDVDKAVDDPLFMRALRDKIGTLAEQKKLSPSIAQTIARTTGFLGEFYGVSQAIGAGLGALGKAASYSRRVAGTSKMLGRTLDVVQGTKRNFMTALPINSHLRLFVDFPVYNALTTIGNPEASMPEAMLHGLGEAAVLSAAGTVARALPTARAAVGLTAKAWPYLGRFARLEKGLALETKDPFGKLGLPTSADEFIDSFFDSGVRGKTLEDSLRRAGLVGPAAQYWVKALEGGEIGATFGAWQWASQQKGWKDAPLDQKALMLLRGFLSPEAIGTGLAFLGSGLLSTYQFYKDNPKPPPELIAGYMDLFRNPPDLKEWERRTALLEEWAKVDPEGVAKFRGPGERTVNTPAERQFDVRETFGEREYPSWMVRNVEPVDEPPDFSTPEGIADYKRKLDAVPKPSESDPRQTPIPEDLTSLGDLKGTGIKGKPHALNSVHEYLRKVEGSDKKYARLEQVPLALFRKTLDWRAAGKPEREGRTLDEMSKVYAEHRADAGQRGKVPIQVVSDVVAAQQERRPSRATAIKMYREGTATAEALMDWFPEAAHVVGDRSSIPGWVGKWDRAVLEAWKSKPVGEAPYLPPAELGPIHNRRVVIESGQAALPEDKAQRRILLEDTYAGDPRFHGMSYADMEKEVLALRNEYGKLGSPQPEMQAAPLNPLHDLLAKAGELTRQAHEGLISLGLLPPNTAVTDPKTAAMILQAARPDAAVHPSVAAAAYAARQASFRAATAVAAKQGWADVGAGLRALEAQERGEALTADIKGELRMHGMLDEYGKVKPAALDIAREHFSQFIYTESGNVRQQDIVSFGAFLPALGIGQPFSIIGPTGMGRTILQGRWLGEKIKGPLIKLLDSSPFARALERTFQRGTGPYQGPMSDRQRAVNMKWANVLSMARSTTILADARIQAAMSGMSAHWNSYAPIPDAHQKFLVEGIESGRFMRARGPEDFERAFPGTGYLFDFYVKEAEMFAETGQRLVDLGVMTSESFEALKGRYVPQMYLRAEDESFGKQLDRGVMPAAFYARAMARGVEDRAAMRILDPNLWASLGVRQETRVALWEDLLQQLMDGVNYWVPESTLGKHKPYARSEWQIAAVEARPGVVKGERVAVDAAGKSLKDRYPEEALRLGLVLTQMRDLRMAKEGEVPGPGQIAYSKPMADRINFFLGHSEHGPIYLDRSVAWEFDAVVSDMTRVAEPEGSFGKSLYWGRTMINWWKAALTIRRAKYWTQNMSSAVFLNHTSASVPMRDFFNSVFFGTGDNADTWRSFTSYSKFLGAGLPRERPETMTEKEWGEAHELKDFLDTSYGGAYAGSLLGWNEIGELYSTPGHPELTKRSMQRWLDARTAAGDYDANANEQISAAILEMSDRMSSSIQKIETRIGKLLGDPDPVAHAQGYTAMSAVNQIFDTAFQKYPAYLRMRREHPDTPRDVLIAASLRGTGDMRNSAPSLRSYTRAISPYNSQLYRMTTGKWPLFYRSVGGIVLQGQFWNWFATRVPLLAREALVHPLKTAAVAGVVTTLTQLIQQATQDDPEEADRFRDEIAYTKYGWIFASPETKAQKEAVQRVLHSVPNPIPGAHLPAGVTEFATRMWERVRGGDPFVLATPTVAGQTRVTSLANLAGPAGKAIDIASGMQGLFSSDPEERVDGMSQLFGKTGELTFGAFYGMPGTVGDVLGGEWSKLARGFATFMADNMPQIYPGLGLMSREGQHLLQQALLEGQTWNQSIAGIIRPYRSETATDVLKDVALSQVWPSRGVWQKRPISGKDQALLQMLESAFGQDIPEASTPEARQAKAAAQAINEELAVVFADTYREYFESGGFGPSLDQKMLGQVGELLFGGTTDNGTGVWAITPGQEPKSALLRFIANQPQSEHHWLIRYARGLLERGTFQEDGMEWLFEFGRRRQIPPTVFSEAVMNAMRDPSGEDLISWWAQQIKGGDREKMETLSQLVYDVKQPDPGNSLVWQTWTSILAAYRAAGMQLPDPVSDRAREDVRRKLEKTYDIRLLLQGAGSLRTGLQLLPERRLPAGVPE